MANVDYLWNKYEDAYSTGNDVVLFAYAEGWNDGGQVIVSNYSDEDYDGYALYLTRDGSYLTIGGDYSGESGTDQNNIYLESRNRTTTLISETSPAKIAAVSFSQNGHISFAAQSGAGTAGSVDGGEAANLDENIKVGVKYTTDRLNNSTPTLAVTAIDAQGTLDVIGSISGTIDSTLKGTLNKNIQEDEETERTTPYSNCTLDASAIRSTGTLTIKGNFQATLNTADTSTIYVWQDRKSAPAASQVSDNVITSYGIDAGGDVSAANGVWQGNVNVSNGSTIISRLNDYTDPTKVKTVTVSGNKIVSTGVNATGAVTVDRFSGSSWNILVKNATIQGEMNYPGSEKDTATATIQDNTILAAGINAASVTAANGAEDLQMNVTASGNKIKGIASGPYNLAKYTDNAINAVGIQASGAVTLNGVTESDAVIDVSATGNYVGGDVAVTGIQAGTLTLGEYKGEVTLTATGNTGSSLNLAAISVDGAMTAGSLKGTISVTENGTTILPKSDSNPSPLASRVYGIKAGTLTVDGLLTSDVAVSVGSSFTSAAISVSGKLTASSYAGTITGNNCTTGLQVGSFATKVTGDDFDLNGSITGVSTGISSGGTLNLRVSGTIVAAEDAIEATSSSGTDDFIRIASGANITGDIELGYGDNTLIIDSGATIDGNIKATYGRLSLYFNLDGEANTNAVVTTDANDATLYSTVYLSINLNDAEDGKTYTLFDFGENDVKANWANRKISFVYDNEIFTETTDADGYLICKNDDESVTVKFTYTDDNEITVSVSGVEAAEAFDASQVVTTYDVEKQTFAIDWSKSSWDIPEAEQGDRIVELEYCLKDADGKDYGESVSVILGNGETSYTIGGILEGESVGWRLRYSSDPYNYKVSGWSEYKWEEADPAGPVVPEVSLPDVSACDPQVGDPGDHTSGTGGVIRTAVARLFWNGAESESPIEHYTVEYVETRKNLTDPAAIASLFDTETVYSKEVTGTEVMVSGLTNGSYVYWRLKATDFDGGESDYQYGRYFQVSRQDKTPPEMTEVLGKVDYNTTDPDNVGITGILAWNEAVETLSGVQNYYVVYGKTGTAEDTWTTITVPAAADDPITLDGVTYSYHISADIENADYTVKICASDMSQNIGDFKTVTWAKDSEGPELTTSSGSIYYTYTPDFGINASISWAAATDKQSGVKYYTVKYKETGTEEEWILADTVDHKEGTENYTVTIKDLDNKNYSYSITAYDFCGNSSCIEKTDELINDAAAPVLAEDPVIVTTTYPKTTVINTEFYWAPGTDQASPGGTASGIEKYELTYIFGDDASTKKTITVMADEIDPETGMYKATIADTYTGGVYSWELNAVDYCGNVSSTQSGSFGGEDFFPPTGEFTQMNAPDPDFSFTETSESGVFFGIPYTIIYKTLNNSKVTFSWDDTYTDTQSDVCYKIQFSSSAAFDEKSTYTFYNLPSDGKKFTLDSSIPTMSVGILEELAESGQDRVVYWRVKAMDNSTKSQDAYGLVPEGNEAEWSLTQSFIFTDGDERDNTEYTYPVAQAQNIQLSNAYEDDCYVSGSTCSFTVTSTGWGVQTVYLRAVSTTGTKVMQSFDYGSLRVASGSAVTDQEVMLADGYYKVTIITEDATGQKEVSEDKSYLVDTTRPTTVTGLQGSRTGTEVTIQWKASSDATGILGYVLYYRIKTADDSAEWKSVNVSDTSYTFDDLPEDTYEFKVLAYDTPNADAGKTESNWSLDSEILTLAGPIREYTTGNFTGLGGVFQLMRDGTAEIRTKKACTDLSGALKNADNWKIVGTGNFNGNALGKEGLLWQDLTTGELVMQNDMTSFAEVNGKTNVLGVLETGYTAKATGDFSGSGMDGALIQCPEVGDISVSTTRGLACFARESSGDMSVGWLGALVNTWDDGVALKGNLGDLADLNSKNYRYEVVGVGDFNGDGRDDVMLRNTMPEIVTQDSTNYAITGSGDVFTFLTGDNDAIKAGADPTVCYAGCATDGWEILGIGDFDADGIDDTLLSNGTDLAGWSMANGQRQSDFSFGSLNADEAFAGIADFNNDGTDDLLIRTISTGDLIAWTIKDGKVTGTLAIV